LSQLSAPPAASASGLTTAFEQGIFAAVESALSEHTRALHITRHASPALAQQVRKGKLDAALVALPLNTEGLHLHPLPYQEPLIAALPASWPEAATRLTLSALNHRPLFWFKRERNPDFLTIRDVFLTGLAMCPRMWRSLPSMMFCWRALRAEKA
jgi:DNA-binding transcriptional LysR family regulator